MRAWICRPGTTLVIGGRLPALGAITERSVVGVKAPGGSAGLELSAGVVAGFVVVRSGLATQVASTSLLPRRASTSAQLGPAAFAATGPAKSAVAARAGHERRARVEG